MEKKDAKLSTDESLERNDFNDTWWITILLLLLGIGFPSCDYDTRTELAELKGKVSVIENLVTKEK